MPGKKYKAIIIVGPDEAGNHNVGAFENLKQVFGDELCLIGDGTREIHPDELKVLEGNVAENAKIHLWGHGSAKKGAVHEIDLIKGSSKTSDVIKILDRYSPAKIDYHIHSCFAGAAIADIGRQDLKEGTSITAHAEPDFESIININYQFIVNSTIEHIDGGSLNQNKLQSFLDNLWREDQTSTIAFNGNKGMFKYSFRPPFREILGEDSNQRYLEFKAKEFVEAVKKYDPRLAASLKAPDYTREQVQQFRKKSFEYRARSGSKQFNAFLEDIARDPRQEWKKREISKLCDAELWQDMKRFSSERTISNIARVHDSSPIEFQKYIPKATSMLPSRADIEVKKRAERQARIETLKKKILEGKKSKELEAKEPPRTKTTKQKEPQKQSRSSQIEALKRKSTKRSLGQTIEERKKELLEKYDEMKGINDKCEFVKKETMTELKESINELDKKPKEFEKAVEKTRNEFDKTKLVKRNIFHAAKYKFQQGINYMFRRLEKASNTGDAAGQAMARTSKSNRDKSKSFVDKLLATRENINTAKTK